MISFMPLLFTLFFLRVLCTFENYMVMKGFTYKPYSKLCAPCGKLNMAATTWEFLPFKGIVSVKWSCHTFCKRFSWKCERIIVKPVSEPEKLIESASCSLEFYLLDSWIVAQWSSTLEIQSFWSYALHEKVLMISASQPSVVFNRHMSEATYVLQVSLLLFYISHPTRLTSVPHSV